MGLGDTETEAKYHIKFFGVQVVVWFNKARLDTDYCIEILSLRLLREQTWMFSSLIAVMCRGCHNVK